MIETGKLLQRRYRIDKQIGLGGMGAVYVATDERFGSVVAIKETLCMDSNFRKAIEREARLLNSLKHAALPRVTDHFEENESQFLVMEYIPGEDLSVILDEQRKPFDVVQIFTWADQLLVALEFLHSQVVPVIHRDIKPQNLKQTAGGQIILLDFGLAKGNPTDAGHQTAAKSIFGYSRNYASIEQIQGTGTDPRSDLYSLAATLYHLATGVAPEDALTRAMAVLCQNPDPLIPASDLRPALPLGLSGVLQRSLDLNAGGRPSTAAEMRQMFRESENYANLSDAKTDTVPIAAVPLISPLTQPVAPAVISDHKQIEAKTELMPMNVSDGAPLGGVVTATAGPRRLSTVGPPAAKGPGSGRALAAAAAVLLLFGGAIGGGWFFYNSRQPVVVDPTVEKVDNPAAAANGGANTIAPETGESSAGMANSMPANIERPKTKTVTDTPAETTRNPDQPTTDQSRGRGENETIDVQSPTVQDNPENTVIIRQNPDGSTTTTRIRKNGVNSPDQRRPPNYPVDRYPGGVDPRNLTPAQRRKIRMGYPPNGPMPPNPSKRP